MLALARMKLQLSDLSALRSAKLVTSQVGPGAEWGNAPSAGERVWLRSCAAAIRPIPDNACRATAITLSE